MCFECNQSRLKSYGRLRKEVKLSMMWRCLKRMFKLSYFCDRERTRERERERGAPFNNLCKYPRWLLPLSGSSLHIRAKAEQAALVAAS